MSCSVTMGCMIMRCLDLKLEANLEKIFMSDKMEPGPIFLLMVRGMEYFLSVSVCVSVYLISHPCSAAGAANVAMLTQVPDR